MSASRASCGRDRLTHAVDLPWWPTADQERFDFFHRIRIFPKEVSQWRELLVREIQEDDWPLRGEPPADSPSARSLLDAGVSALREIARILLIKRPVEAVDGADAPTGLDSNARRVLVRIDPYQTDRVKLETAALARRPHKLTRLIPPRLDSILPEQLAVHGRSICRLQRPSCESCDIRGFCEFYRRQKQSRSIKAEQPVTVDLFCGAGGMSEGFARAGFRPVLAVDSDASALRTYLFNRPELSRDRAICRDISALERGTLRRAIGGRAVDVLLAAPPCQGFSSVGKRSKRSRENYKADADRKNHLFNYVIAAAEELRPKLVLMENVPGMKSARTSTGGNRAFLEAAAKGLERLGYETAVWELNAVAYGVPQFRKRTFLVGSRIRMLPPIPEAEYESGTGANFDPDMLPAISFDEATFDLPALEAGSGQAILPYPLQKIQSDSRRRRYLLKFGLDARGDILFNHAARYNNAQDLELYALLRPGEDSVHAIERHGREDLMRYRRDIFDDKYARLRGDRPSKSIVSHLAKDGNGFIHPTQVRSITVREAARLQSFPDDYLFCGSRSDQWIQVGNAVPPVLAQAIARSFLLVLRRGKTR